MKFICKSIRTTGRHPHSDLLEARRFWANGSTRERAARLSLVSETTGPRVVFTAVQGALLTGHDSLLYQPSHSFHEASIPKTCSGGKLLISLFIHIRLLLYYLFLRPLGCCLREISVSLF